MPTNTPSYTICSAPIVYIFVYILIETRIAPLTIFINSFGLSHVVPMFIHITPGFHLYPVWFELSHLQNVSFIVNLSTFVYRTVS